MPQLNPAPWFALLMCAWFVFLTIIPTKVKAFPYPNDPNYQKKSLSNTQPWSWPWH